MEIEKAIVLYYDRIRFENGEGFYVYPLSDKDSREIIIVFAKKTDKYWYQITKHNIMCFVEQPDKVLEKLEPNSKIGTKIYNRNSQLLYEKRMT